MCTSIYVRGSEDDIDNIGALAEILGGTPPIYVKAGYHSRDAADFGSNECLCPVDIPTTLIEAGFRVWKEPNDDPWCYHCERVG
jgi:hypothetical protein